MKGDGDNDKGDVSQVRVAWAVSKKQTTLRKKAGER